MNFVKEYWTHVFSQFLADHERGLTPNPDIACNKEIKFGFLHRKFLHGPALNLVFRRPEASRLPTLSWLPDNVNIERLSHAETVLDTPTHLATGHYARLLNGNNEYQLFRGADRFKDQSYYLSAVRSFHGCIFPLGDLIKSDVRRIASDIGLQFLLKKKESTGICFIGEQRRFSSFLNEYLGDRPGRLVDLDTGQNVGRHPGIWFYTIGQRARISGCLQKYYVARKNLQTDNIFVVSSPTHPALQSRRLLLRDLVWMAGDAEKRVNQCQIRYRSDPSPCFIQQVDQDKWCVHVIGPAVTAAAPGQTVALYQYDRCLGSGVLVEY